MRSSDSPPPPHTHTHTRRTHHAGAVGILEAKTENDQQYIQAYCDPNDDGEHVWLYWMAGASGAILPFTLLGTVAIMLWMKWCRKHDTDYETDVAVNVVVAMTFAVIAALLFFSLALLCCEYMHGTLPYLFRDRSI